MLKEEHKLKVSEDRVQGRTFGAKRDEVMGRCRKSHNEPYEALH
jgi:hypothetical protein